MTEWAAVLAQYGWAGVILWIVVERLGPLARDWIVPERAAARRKRERADEQERERLKNLEERQVAAFEKVADALAQLSRSYELVSERMSHVENGVDALLDRRRRRRKADADAE